VLELDRASGRAVGLTAYRYREADSAGQTPQGRGA